MKKALPTKAVIYCRVSSDKQAREGDGLQSQETRCREYAIQQKLDVVKVFKDAAVSGAAMPDERHGMREMFAFLATRKDSFTVIIDDISRLARSQKAYIEFISLVTQCGAEVASPSHKFGSAPEEALVTEISVSLASYHREKNKEQVKNRQRARLMNGFWTFGVPTGYKYVKHTAGGKVLALSEPKAKAVTEALKGFAVGRFETQADVAHFLAQSQAFNQFSLGQVRGLLTNVLFTGHLEYPEWGVSLREGKHPALIDMRTHDKILMRLGLKARAPYRKDLNADFPLRGFILCSACGEQMTAAWSTGRVSKHPYYRCKKRGCSLYGKGLSREEVEGNFEALLQDMRPSDAILSLAKEVVYDCWKQKKGEFNRQLAESDREKKELDLSVQKLTSRLLNTDDPIIVKVYESQLKDMEVKRQHLAVRSREMYGIDTSFEDALGTVFDFIGNPHSMWTNGGIEDKRLVLKLAFAKRLPYSKKEGFGTALTSLPFKVFREMAAGKVEMVEGEGFEPSNS